MNLFEPPIRLSHNYKNYYYELTPPPTNLDIYIYFFGEKIEKGTCVYSHCPMTHNTLLFGFFGKFMGTTNAQNGVPLFDPNYHNFAY